VCIYVNSGLLISGYNFNFISELTVLCVQFNLYNGTTILLKRNINCFFYIDNGFFIRLLLLLTSRFFICVLICTTISLFFSVVIGVFIILICCASFSC